MDRLTEIKNISISEITLKLKSELADRDYQVISKWLRLLGYKSVAEWLKQSVEEFQRCGKSPHFLYKTELAQRIDSLIQRCRLFGPFDLVALYKYRYIKKNSDVFDRMMAIFVAINGFELNNKKVVEDVIGMGEGFMTFRQASGETISEKEKDAHENLKQLNQLIPWPEVNLPYIVPTSGSETQINDLANKLFILGFINDKDNFQLLFTLNRSEIQKHFELSWNSTQKALVFLFLMMEEIELIETEQIQDFAKNLSIFTSKGKAIPAGSLKTSKNRMDHEKDLREYAKSAKNKDYRSILKIIDSIK